MSNILLNVLVHLLQHLSQVFDLDALAFCYFVIKICFTIKINSICGAGQDTCNLRHKFNSQGPALRIMGLRVAISNSQSPSSRALGVRVPCSRVPESWDTAPQSPRSQGLRVLGLRFPGLSVPVLRVLKSRVLDLRVSDPGSQVLILD